MTFKFQLVIKEGKGHWGRRTRVTNEHGRVLLMEEFDIIRIVYVAQDCLSLGTTCRAHVALIRSMCRAKR